VLADLDIREDRDPKKNAKHKAWNAQITEAARAGRVMFLTPDFESISGLPHDESEKIDRAMELFSSMTRDDLPAPLQDVANAVVAIA
jgi:hypothetical protein